MTSSPNTPLTGGAILGNGLEAATYKATAVATVQEYLNSNDMQEVCSTLEELQQPQLAHIFVKQVSKGWFLLGGHAALCCACFGFDVDAAQLADIFVKAGQ